MTEERQRSTAEAPSVFGLVIRTFGALALIVGLIVAIAYGIRKFGGPRFGATRDDSPELSVLSSVSLGDKRSLAVVKFGERTLLVGSTAQAITLLVSEPTGSLASSPTPRSVAEILRDEEPSGFDDEIALATRRLEDEPANWDNAGGIA
jgi:flagellar protein FliO/FliZ